MRALLQSKIFYLIVAALFLAIFLSRLPSVNQPFGRDQGIFACIGQNILKGSVPYRDLWDQKPPGIHFTYALLLGLFSNSMRAVQATGLAALVLTAYLVYSVVREISGRRAGTLSALIFFFYSDPLFYGYGRGYWARSQTETYMLPLLVAGLWAFVRFLRSGSGRSAWLAGLFWGGSFLFKYTAVFYPLSALVFLGLLPDSAEGRLSRRAVGGLGRTMLLLGCGFGACLLPAIVYFAAHGALDDLIGATALYNLKYAGAVSAGPAGPGSALGQAGKWIPRNPFLWLTGMAGALLVALRARRQREALIWLFWLAAAWGAIVANRRYFHYHYIQIAPPLAILSGCLLDWCIGWTRKRKLLLVIVPALAACLLLLTLDLDKVRQNLKPDLDFALGKTPEPEYLVRFVTGDFSFLADMYLAEYLEERTAPEDAIFIFGFEPLVYFLAERRPACRYIFNDPVTAPYVDDDTRAAALYRMLADLAKSKPAYIVIVEGDANPVDPTDSYSFFENTPPLRSVVDAGYVLDRQARKFHIYERR